jgi:hypothetical protein
MLSSGVTALESRPCRGLAERKRHRAVIAAQGSELLVDVDETYRLRASDSSLPRGNVALSARDGRLRVHGLSILFPPTKTRQP